MLILDTDHITHLFRAESKHHAELVRRLEMAPESPATTIITVEEQLRGWLAFIRELRDVRNQQRGYAKLQKFLQDLRALEVVPLGDRAVEICCSLAAQRVRIGTQDRKIAAISLSHDALLLSDNLRDFRRVPNLRVESWLS